MHFEEEKKVIFFLNLMQQLINEKQAKRKKNY